LHARLRKGAANTARGIARFVDELVARLRRAGAVGELTFRMDSGFWSAKLIRRLRAHKVHYSITVRQTKTVRAAITAIPDAAWVSILYALDGVAEVAETPYQGDRLIVRASSGSSPICLVSLDSSWSSSPASLDNTNAPAGSSGTETLAVNRL
jgi:hypothetical protein